MGREGGDRRGVGRGSAADRQAVCVRGVHGYLCMKRCAYGMKLDGDICCIAQLPAPDSLLVRSILLMQLTTSVENHFLLRNTLWRWRSRVNV